MIEGKLIKFLKDQMEEISSGLCTHPVESLEKYNRQVGKHNAYQETLDFINQLLSEDDEQHR